MAGVVYTGLDYSAVPATLDLHGIPKPRRLAVFRELRIIEGAALKVLNKAPDKDG